MVQKEYIGNELKYLVDITSAGFSMADDNFEVVIKCGNKKVTILKEDMVVDEQGKFYIRIDTSLFRPGDLVAITYVYVPDEDFEDGLRTEVDRTVLLKLEAI